MSDNTVFTDSGIEVYEDNIYIALDQYIKERGIKDMSKETQGRWNAALMFIRKQVFANSQELMSEVNMSMYDEYKVNQICDIYINLCYEYDKEISINGFSFLTGIHRDTIYTWGNEEYRAIEYYDSNNNRIGNIAIWKVNHPGEQYIEKLGSSCSDIYKKLVLNNEESLSCKLISGGLNPMKILPALNRRHNWNMPGNSRPGGEERPTIEQIEQQRRERLGEKPISELPKADF